MGAFGWCIMFLLLAHSTEPLLAVLWVVGTILVIILKGYEHIQLKERELLTK